MVSPWLDTNDFEGARESSDDSSNESTNDLEPSVKTFDEPHEENDGDDKYDDILLEYQLCRYSDELDVLDGFINES